MMAGANATARWWVYAARRAAAGADRALREAFERGKGRQSMGPTLLEGLRIDLPQRTASACARGRDT
jgi:hypothetical protein